MHFMKKTFFHHENTKFRKARNLYYFFFVFLSFRAFVIN